MSIKLTPRKKLFVETAAGMYGNGAVIDKQEIRVAAEKAGIPYPTWMSRTKVGYNQHKLPDLEVPAFVAAASTATISEETAVVNLIASNMEKQNLVPAPFVGFVPWGNFSTIEKIVKSGLFYPIFITGLSGNGKTLMVEQVHASLNKELIRVNITIETDEDDLLGGFRLINGETKFVPGPVIEAMERGATLLLDEVDLGSNKLLALQPVLEGKGVFLKKVNTWITPRQGFNVMATANTKGQGSADGRFIGTNILNEAFLERFAITIEQPYASPAIEIKIVLAAMKKYGVEDNEFTSEFAKNLVSWADVIRKTFADGGVADVISTRRLDHICKAYKIFGSKQKSLELCLARFELDVKDSFLDLFSKIDSGLEVENMTEEELDATSSDDNAF